MAKGQLQCTTSTPVLPQLQPPVTQSRPPGGLGLTAAKRLTPTAYCLGMVVLVVPASCTAV
jgi:hypothetical protein